MNIINEKVVEYLDSVYKPINNQLLDLRKYAEENHIPVILKDSEELILNLLRIKNPVNILEIGTAIGYSAICFAETCSNSNIVTIEYNKETKEEAESNIKAFGLNHRIKVILGDGVSVLREMNNEEKFDFVFIDAGKSHYKNFFEESLRLCKGNAIIVSDNVLMQGKTVSDEYDPYSKFKTNIRKMREYIEYITNLDYVKTSVIPVGDGLAISIIGDLNE